LEPYIAGRAAFDENLAQLQRETADNPAQVARWQDLERRGAAWRREAVEPGLALRRAVAGGAGSFDDVIAHVRTRQGKQQIDAMRRIFAAAGDAEQALLSRRIQESTTANAALLTLLVLGGIATIGLGVGVAGLLAWSIGGAVGQVADGAERIARGDLDRRIRLARGD
jgi:methyl-accepting chemotaxis protein